MAAPQIRRSSQLADDYNIAEEEEYYVTRPHTSVRRYRQPVQRDTLDDMDLRQVTNQQTWQGKSRTTADNERNSRALGFPVASPRKWRAPWVAIAGGMLLALMLVIAFSSLGSWWQTHQEDAAYGMPRTYQVDAVVGHNDSVQKPSHFVFMNLNSHIVIMEFPGGDATHAIVYSGPVLFGNGSNLIPVTAQFRDVNGDGRPDMLVFIQNQTIIYLNNGTKFVPK